MSSSLHIIPFQEGKLVLIAKGLAGLFSRKIILVITEGARKGWRYIMFEIRSLWVLHGNMMFPYKVSHRF